MSISQIQNYKHPAPYLENYTGNEYDTHSNSISCARFTIDCDYDHEFYDSFDDTVQLVRVGQAKAQPRSQYQPLACALALALALALGAGFCVGVVAGPFSFFFETLTLVGLTPLELLVKHFSNISESIDARSEALPLVVHHTESVVAHRRARGAPFAGKKQDVSFCTWRSERPVASHGAALSCVAPSVVRGPERRDNTTLRVATAHETGRV